MSSKLKHNGGNSLAQQRAEGALKHPSQHRVLKAEVPYANQLDKPGNDTETNDGSDHVVIPGYN